MPTLSAFAREVGDMVDNRLWALAGVHLADTSVLGVGGAWTGLSLVR